MPRFLDETLTRSLYRQPQPQTHAAGQPVTNPVPAWTYGRDFYRNMGDLFTNRASGMVNLGVATNASMLVVGSAFGYLMEALITVGIADVWGIEPGGWFWDAANDAEWAVGMKARTADDWIGSGTEQASLNALGIPGQARFTFIIDEDAATMHSDAELPVFIAGCEARLQGNARGRIIHLVTPTPLAGPGDSAVNWKTLTEWKAVAPSHRWFDFAGNEG